MSQRVPVDDALRSDELPPKPKKPLFLPLIGVIRRPETPSEKFVTNASLSVAAGFFAGTVQAWWNDYRKVPKIVFRESLRHHMRYFKGPFAVVTAAGLAYSTVSAYNDYQNMYHEKPVGVRKDQTLRQQVVGAAIAGSMFGLHTQKIRTAIEGAILLGGLVWYTQYLMYDRNDYNKKRALMLYRQRFEKLPEDQMPAHLRNYKADNNHMIYSPSMEDRVARPIFKKDSPRVVYSEE